MDERDEHVEASFQGIDMSGGGALGRTWIEPVSSTIELAALSTPSWGRETEVARILRAVERVSAGLGQTIVNVSSGKRTVHLDLGLRGEPYCPGCLAARGRSSSLVSRDTRPRRPAPLTKGTDHEEGPFRGPDT